MKFESPIEIPDEAARQMAEAFVQWFRGRQLIMFLQEVSVREAVGDHPSEYDDERAWTDAFDEFPLPPAPVQWFTSIYDYGDDGIIAAHALVAFLEKALGWPTGPVD